MAPRRKRARLDEPLGAFSTLLSAKSVEERRLEAELFGRPSAALPQDEPVADDALEVVADEQLYFVDDSAPTASTSALPPAKAEKKPAKRAEGRPALWHDPADDAVNVSLRDAPRLRKLRATIDDDLVGGAEYSARLKKQFEKTNPAPAWAKAARTEAIKRKERTAEDDHGVSSILRQAGAGTKSRRGGALKSGEITLTRLKDANVASNSRSAITSLGFHPEVQVMFTTAQDKRLKLYTIDGTHNPILQSILTPDLPMTAGVFSPAGDRILLTGPRPYFFTYDLQGGQMVKSMRGLWNEGLGGTDTETSHSGGLHHARYSPDGSLIAIAGRRGYVHLLDARNPGSGQVVGQLRVPNGQLAGLTWSADGTTITTASKEAEVYVWDVRSQSCVSRWRDEGGFGTCKIEADASGQYLAIGSTTGIVNVYDGASHPTAGPPNALGAFPERKPLKAVMNLTTAVSSMRFNHDASILALASDQKKDQLKLVHRPSLTVFSNWPTSQTPLGQVSALAFSRGSEYLAIGNHKGNVLLYSIEHFARRR